MKNIFKIFNISVLLGFLSLVSLSCNRGSVEEDDLDQERISNVVFNVKDLAGNQPSVDYNYQINSATFPKIKLEDGHTYEVSVSFLNGTEDVTGAIKKAVDEHFMVYNFTRSDIEFTRTDDATSTRKDKAKVGLKTRWKVNKAEAGDGAQIIVTLYHESKTVSEDKNGVEWGKQTGGETDAEIKYGISK